MSTQFKPIEIPPGVVSTATTKMRSSNWSQVNLVRWRENQLMPIGGQLKYSYSFASRCKLIHTWIDLAGVQRIAYLCEQHLYVDAGGTLTDITPAGGMTAPSFASGGYGDGVYGTNGNYGDPRAISSNTLIDKVPSAYSLDNFGAILLAMTSTDGKLLFWDPASAPGTKAAPVVADATRGVVPTGRCFVVTPERFVLIFGAFDATNLGGSNRFAWCDQENYKAWDYADITSQAGFLDIQPSSPIICAIATRTGVLFWTGTNAYRSRFLGLPYIYNYEELSANCTPWSPQSMVNTTSMVVWFSEQGAFSFDGTSILPVTCKVRHWIDDKISSDSGSLAAVREEACAVHVENFNEFWWFFPQGAEYNPGGKNNMCVIYNYREGWWAEGMMSRSAGISSAYNQHTVMANGTRAYQHEVAGQPHWDISAAPFAETFNLNLVSGSRLTTVKQLIPDIESVGDPDDYNAIGSVMYSLFYRNSRSLGALEQQSPPQPVRDNGYVDFRVTGRDVRLRLGLSNSIIKPITVGAHLIDAVPRGDR